MKRLLILSLLCVGCAAQADAFPWKRVLFYGGVVASSALASHASYDCRHRNGPEPCTMHYGSLQAFTISNAGLTAVAIALSEKGHKDKFKEWFVPALAMGTVNSYWAAHEWRIRAKEIDRR